MINNGPRNRKTKQWFHKNVFYNQLKYLISVYKLATILITTAILNLVNKIHVILTFEAILHKRAIVNIIEMIIIDCPWYSPKYR